MKQSLDKQMLLIRAREQGLWLRSTYQDVWFSPDELEVEWKKGNFMWDVTNWELRDPQERVRELVEGVAKAIKKSTDFEARVARSKGVPA